MAPTVYISDADTTTFIRSLVGEATAKYWTDAEITLYKKMGMMVVMSRYWHLLAPIKQLVVSKGTVSGTATVDFPDDHFKPIKLEVAETKRTLAYVNPNELFKIGDWDATGTPILWTIRDGKIYLYPTPDTTDTDYFNYWYLPYLGTIVDFPEPLRPIICIEAAILGRAKDKSVTNDLIALRDLYEQDTLIAISVPQMQEAEMFRDYETAEMFPLPINED